MDDLDDMRLYHEGVVWEFSITPERCKQSMPGEQFFESHTELLPMHLTARLKAAFGEDTSDYGFSVDHTGAVTVDEL